MNRLILFLSIFSLQLFAGGSFGSSQGGGGGTGNILSINGDTTAAQVIDGSNNISVSTAGGTTTINGTLLAPKASPTFTGTVTTPATASRALVTGASSELTASTTTATEIGYVNGVTSAIQTQLNAKAPSAAPTFTTSTTHSYATASTVPYFDSSKNLVSSAVTPTQLGYLDATSSIQTQLNAKQTSDTQLTSLAALSYTGNASKVVRLNAGETDFEFATISSGVGGSTGATDNRVLRADGTGGSTLQNSALGIDDSGRLSVTTSGNVASDIYNQNNTFGGNSTSGSAFGVYTYMLASSTANQDFGFGGSWGNVAIVDGNNNDTASKGAGGVAGWARGGNIIIGTAGVAYSGRGTNARLIGVYGHGDTAVVGGGATMSTSIGGYFDTGTGGGTVPASGITSALVANNLATSHDIIEGLDNGTLAFAVKDGGIVQMGATSATPKHIVNSDTYTTGSDALTIGNGPTGKAGAAAGYLKITINGTDRAIPYW